MNIKRGSPTVIVGVMSVGWLLACAGESPGQRNATGECPQGEVCSDLTPNGLVFVGEALYNDDSVKLGPIAKGGRFDLGVHSADGEPLPALEFRIEDPTIMEPTTGTGEFNDGNSSIDVDGYLSLRGLRAGRTYVRVVDPATGELYDRLEVKVSEIGEVRLTNAHNPDQPFTPGSEDALGVEIITADGEDERAFDLDMDVQSSQADLGVDPGMWDCFLFNVPTTGVSEMGFDVAIGDYQHHGVMPVAEIP